MKIFLSTFLPFYLSTFLYCQTIELDKKSIDFGNVKEHPVLEYSLSVKNTSKNILKVGVRSSCDCITLNPERFDLKQNQRMKIKVKLDTTGYNGNFNEKIFVQSNDQKNPYITIEVKGYISTEGKVTIPVTVFDSAGCLFCIELRKSILPLYEKKYGIKLELDEYSIDKPENYSSLVALEKKLGKTLNKIPVVFIGMDIIGGKKEIKKNLPRLIEKYIKLGGAEKIALTGDGIRKNEVLKKLKIFPVISAGLIDSVNPCAFATIIFFITYLSMVLKKQRYEIFFAGIFFIIGVFVTYFLIGLGAFGFIRKINQFHSISKIMYLAVGMLAIFVSYIHFRDALTIKRGVGIGAQTIKMKLPEPIRWKIYDVVTKFTALKYLLPVAFLIGVIITVLELFCTGQIYLPTILYLVGLPELRTTGIFYLLLYCILFILPLIIIFSLFYFGLNIDWLETVFRKKIFLIKLLMSIFFLTLGVLIFVIALFT